MGDRSWWAREGLECVALVVAIWVGIIWILKALGII